MGIISILLGIITFFLFTGGGAIIAMNIKNMKENLTNSVVTLSTVSNTGLIAIIILIFAFIGLFIGMNLIMHGATYRRIRNGGTSLGYICIVLGLIALCCLTWVGLRISYSIVDHKDMLSMLPALSFLRDKPSLLIIGVITGFFTFIGLLMCINMTMHGLIYKKTAKYQTQLKRRG